VVNTAIILAGGLGTRLKAVSPNTPKPMVIINGRPFLEYQMDYWINQGITRFILSVGYLKEVIINHFGDSFNGASIEYVIESEPLGTGGGMLLAAQNIKELFIVLNGDTYIEVDLNSLYKFHEKLESDWTFALFSTSDANRYLPMDISPSGKILSFQSKLSKKSGLANGGVYLIEPPTLNLLDFNSAYESSLENQLLPNLLNNGAKLFGQECTGKFIDIGLPDDYYRAASILI
jgi:D-glycero-alpha-D-manno-heptose 1-phosphate guanylyltransferase